MNLISRCLVLACLQTSAQAVEPAPPPDMVWIAGGTFAMGNDLAGGRMDEKP
ncbi:hypothetical protein HQ447_15745, partial [bacterium]|nr:hypothetical protein [bacterium]